MVLSPFVSVEMAWGVSKKQRVMQHLAIGLLLLSLTQAQELTRTNKLPVESESELEPEPEATTSISTDIPELIELTTDAVIAAETTTEIPAQADIVPAVATENRNSGVDLSAASESESKETPLDDGDDEVRYSTQRCDSDLVGFEIVTG